MYETTPAQSSVDELSVLPGRTAHRHSLGPRTALRCHACGRTFAETKGTVFFGCPYPIWLITVVVTLLAFGCPPAAVVAAFFLDERTLSAWHRKAGLHAKGVQETRGCQEAVERS